MVVRRLWKCSFTAHYHWQDLSGPSPPVDWNNNIIITIWWWDEQACLMYANNIQDNFYDLVLCISLASSSRQIWSYHVYSWSLTSKLDAFLYSMVRRLHVWWWSIWFRQWNALLPNVMVFNALLPNVMHWFLIACTGDDIFSGELGEGGFFPFDILQYVFSFWV